MRTVIRFLCCLALIAGFLGIFCLGKSGNRAVGAPSAAAATPAIDYAPVEAFLKANCIECHGPTKQKGNIALHTYHDAASVIKDRKTWETVLEKVQAGEMPPKKKARPDKAQSEVFVKTIETIFFQHDLVTPRDPGHVTIRRLNKTEYNNTVRDLVGIDIRPAEDFPSDDVGQGFDNIGDVLSISPVLMERYLAAADAIMTWALPLEPPRPIQHRVNWRYLEPAIRESSVPKGQRRPLLLNKSVFTHYTVSDEGDYTIGFTIFPDQPITKPPPKNELDIADPANEPAPEPAEVAILVDGKQIESFKVTKGDRKSLMDVHSKVQLAVGDHRLELALIHTPKDDKTWILRVNAFSLDGPPDLPKSKGRLLACDATLSKPEQARVILSRFAARAYRRPITTDEIGDLLKLAADTEKQTGNWEAGIQMALEAVLVSPKFLFRVELDDRPDTAGPHPIDEYQLASRLSYFLWSTMPDEELLELAAKKQLSANIEAQTLRMLKDPRADSLVDNFAMQWLQLRRLRSFAPDTQMFPFNERLRSAMGEETRLFVQSIIREDRSIIDLIDSDYTFVNGPLARFYHFADTNGNPTYQKPIRPRGKPIDQNEREFVRVNLPDHMRGGVLTEASVLCVTSNPTRTSPVKRGKFVLEQILGTPPPPPPANVPPLTEVKTVAEGGTAKISLRQRMEQHRADPACANCHEHMDGIGFAFENFDAIGSLRTTDGGMEIDPSGTMPDGSSFRGPIELKSMLKEHKQLFARCLTKKLLTYGIGRGIEYYDQTAVNKIVAALEKNGYRFSTLVVEIAKSDPFRLRRGKEQNP